MMPFIAIAWGFIQNGFSAVLTFCSKPPGSWIAAAIALAVGLWWFGQHEFNLGKAACQAQVITKIQKQIEYQDRVTAQVVTKYIKVQAADAAHTLSVIEEIPVHVTPQINADFPLPCALGRVFNDAWHGPVPDPAACPDASASDTNISTVAKAEAENAGKYDAISHQLVALQEWISEQQNVPK